MNADDVLTYGHRTVLSAVEGPAPEQWEIPGACGVWSIKDIVAHLASYELVLADICSAYLDAGPTSCLDLFREEGAAFNNRQVEQRRGQTAQQTVTEYADAQQRAAELVARIPVDERRRAGRLAWYGAEYDLEDQAVYMYYGHKREHCAQIAAFRDRVTR